MITFIHIVLFSKPSDWYSSRSPLASTAGTLNRNENRAASSLFNPLNNPPVIVVPERDAPGIKANAWAMPMIRESSNEISLSVFFFY